MSETPSTATTRHRYETQFNSPHGVVTRMLQAVRTIRWMPRLDRMRTRFDLWRRTRRSRKALDQLDARNLQDIGLRRTASGYVAGPSTCERDHRLIRAMGQSWGVWR